MENLFFIDTETGGLKSYSHGLCTICIKKNNSNYIKNLTFYPQKKIYEVRAFNVNHLSLEELYSKGESREALINVINDLYKETGESKTYLTFAGWNVGFDIDFINQVFRDKSAKFPCPILSFDLKEIAMEQIKKKDKRKKEDDGVEDYKLTTIYQHLFNDFEEEKAHTADYDTIMCERVYCKFKELGWIENE